MQPIASWRLRPGIRLHRSIRCIIKGIDRKLQPAPCQRTESSSIDDEHAGCIHSDRLLRAPQPVACTGIHLKPSGIRPARTRIPRKMPVPHWREGTVAVAHEERAAGKVTRAILAVLTKLTRTPIWAISAMGATPCMVTEMLQARNRTKGTRIRLHTIADPCDMARTAALVRSIMLRGNPLREEHQHCVGRNDMRRGRRIHCGGAQDCSMTLAEHRLSISASASRLMRYARP